MARQEFARECRTTQDCRTKVASHRNKAAGQRGIPVKITKQPAQTQSAGIVLRSKRRFAVFCWPVSFGWWVSPVSCKPHPVASFAAFRGFGAVCAVYRQQCAAPGQAFGTFRRSSQILGGVIFKDGSSGPLSDAGAGGSSQVSTGWPRRQRAELVDDVADLERADEPADEPGQRVIGVYPGDAPRDPRVMGVYGPDPAEAMLRRIYHGHGYTFPGDPPAPAGLL